MPDDTPMATLESIATQLTTVVAKVDALATRVDAVDARLVSVDARFDGIDKRFDGIDKRFDGIDKRFDGVDKRFDGVDKRLDGIDAKIETSEAETRAQLGMRIEAVDDNVKRVYDAVIALQEHDTANVEHAAFDRRLEDHDLRILALENPTPPTRPPE